MLLLLLLLLSLLSLLLLLIQSIFDIFRCLRRYLLEMVCVLGLKPAETSGTCGIALNGELAEDGRQRLGADGIGWHDDTWKRTDRVTARNRVGDVLFGFYSRAEGSFGALALELSHGELFAKAFDTLAKLVDV